MCTIDDSGRSGKEETKWRVGKIGVEVESERSGDAERDTQREEDEYRLTTRRVRGDEALNDVCLQFQTSRLS